MNLSLTLNVIGLVLDMAGVVIIFIYGIAPLLELGGHSIIVSKKASESGKGKELHYKRSSRIGLALVLIGFLLQTISNFLS